MEERIKLIISIIIFIVLFIGYCFFSQWEKKVKDRKKTNERGKKLFIILSKFLTIFLMFIPFVIPFFLNYGGIIQEKCDGFVNWIYNFGSRVIRDNENREEQDIVSTSKSPEKSPYIPTAFPISEATEEPTLIPTEKPTPEPAVEPTPTPKPTLEPTAEPTVTTTPEQISTPTPTPTVTPVYVSEGQNPSEGSNLMTYVNQYRADAGVAALAWNSDLEQSAKDFAEMGAAGMPIITDGSTYVIGRQCNGAKNAQKAVSDWITGNAYISSESTYLLNVDYTQMGGALYYLSNGNEYGYHYFWVICLQ